MDAGDIRSGECHLLWILPRAHLPHFTGSVLGRCASYYIHRGGDGLDAHWEAVVAGCNCGGPGHHCCFSAVELEHVQGDGRGEAETVGLLRRSCLVADADFRVGYRKRLQNLAMTSRLVCYFVLAADIFRHGDGAEDAYL